MSLEHELQLIERATVSEKTAKSAVLIALKAASQDVKQRAAEQGVEVGDVLPTTIDVVGSILSAMYAQNDAIYNVLLAIWQQGHECGDECQADPSGLSDGDLRAFLDDIFAAQPEADEDERDPDGESEVIAA